MLLAPSDYTKIQAFLLLTLKKAEQGGWDWLEHLIIKTTSGEVKVEYV